MIIKVSLSENINYSSGMDSFPINIDLITDEIVEIYSDIDAMSAWLTKSGSLDVSFGFSKMVTHGKRGTIVLYPQVPLRLEVDIFEYDDDLSNFTSGVYDCSVQLVVGLKGENGFFPTELSQSIEINVE